MLDLSGLTCNVTNVHVIVQGPLNRAGKNDLTIVSIDLNQSIIWNLYSASRSLLLCCTDRQWFVFSV